jgi:hypothetical protein
MHTSSKPLALMADEVRQVVRQRNQGGLFRVRDLADRITCCLPPENRGPGASWLCASGCCLPPLPEWYGLRSS